METKTIIRVKPYSTKEIADIYGVSPKTLYKWMKPIKKKIGERRGRFYTVNQVRTILDEIGLPSIIEI
ncbi:MAG: helix-turn-helix domain-containing protein [Bacteroidetes bacterium]|nr:helix-turn-helix domain-containing protein [Bacteroidota bacterium]NOG95545.1 helix-turn-helix domain-containing protein [Bacteroidota bacterium]GIK70141.1 MAG: hypothetical protein BroJett020_14360 [Bacteroidota bacterium]